MKKINILIANIAVLSIVLLVGAGLFVLVASNESHATKAIYSGTENHNITLEQAKQLTQAYQSTRANGEVVAAYFGRNIFEQLLEQKNCVGIRIYSAKRTSGEPALVLVGVSGSGEDITEGPIGDLGSPCPPFCGVSRPLGPQIKSEQLAMAK